MKRNEQINEIDCICAHRIQHTETKELTANLMWSSFGRASYVGRFFKEHPNDAGFECCFSHIKLFAMPNTRNFFGTIKIVLCVRNGKTAHRNGFFGNNQFFTSKRQLLSYYRKIFVWNIIFIWTYDFWQYVRWNRIFFLQYSKIIFLKIKIKNKKIVRMAIKQVSSR